MLQICVVMSEFISNIIKTLLTYNAINIDLKYSLNTVHRNVGSMPGEGNLEYYLTYKISLI